MSFPDTAQRLCHLLDTTEGIVVVGHYRLCHLSDTAVRVIVVWTLLSVSVVLTVVSLFLSPLCCGTLLVVFFKASVSLLPLILIQVFYTKSILHR